MTSEAVGREDPRAVRRGDLALVGGLLVVNLAQVFWVQPVTIAGVDGSAWIGPVYAVVTTVPLVWRRAHPVVAAFVASALYWVPTDAFLFTGYVMAIVIFFSVGRWAGGWTRGALVCCWAGVAGSVGTVLGTAEEPVPGLFGVWLVVLAPYLLGRLVLAQHEDADARLVAERELTRQQAVREERARIVRELHDVVGHEITLLSIQSEAAAQSLALAPERATGPVDAMRDTARRANRELRAILHLLGDEEPPVAVDRRGLVEVTRRASEVGIPTVLEVRGEPWQDCPRHWLAINRIVQECLTNAGKHAPGETVRVGVDFSPVRVRLEASNAAVGRAGEGSGLGIPGMAERARLLDGTLDVTSREGRFVVTATLPHPGEEWP